MSHNEKKLRFTQQMRRESMYGEPFPCQKQNMTKMLFERLKIEKRQQKIARHGRKQRDFNFEVSIWR